VTQDDPSAPGVGVLVLLEQGRGVQARALFALERPGGSSAIVVRSRAPRRPRRRGACELRPTGALAGRSRSPRQPCGPSRRMTGAPWTLSILVEWDNALFSEMSRCRTMLRTVRQQIDDARTGILAQVQFPVQLVIAYDQREVASDV